MVALSENKKLKAKNNPDLLIVPDKEASKIRMNPDLVIRNPKDSDRKKVWRKLRKHLSPEKAALAFEKIFPDAKKKMPGRKPSKAVVAKLMKDPEFRKALRKFKKFHGREADLSQLREVDIPQLKHEDDLYLIPLGKGPAVSYDASKMIPGSNKANAVYVHPFGEKTGEQPTVVVSSDGKLIMYLPGKHKVTDWVRG